MEVSFASDCKTARDFAQRFRVLAALTEEPVQFTLPPDQLRAMARYFDRMADAPQVYVVAVEVEKPITFFAAAYWTFLFGVLFFGVLGDAALWVLSLIGWL
jgi:hypothetical protein